MKNILVMDNFSIKTKSTKAIKKESSQNTFSKIYNLFFRIKRKISTKLNFVHEDLNKIENKWL